MNKTLKIIGALILLAGIIAAISSFFILRSLNPDKLKQTISTAVYQQTGRRLTFDGKVSWALFPSAGFKLSNVSLSNPEALSSKPFINFKHVDVRLKLLPLLFNKFDIRNISIDGMTLNLIKTADGQNNWQDIGDKLTSTPSASTLNFSIANLSIVNSAIHWLNKASQQQYTLNNVFFNGQNVGTKTVFPLTISFKLKPQSGKPLTVNMQGNFNIAPDFQSLSFNQLKADINKLPLTSDLTIKHNANGISYQGDLQVPSNNLRETLDSFGIKLPNNAAKNAYHNFAIELAFNGTNKNLSIKPFKFHIDDTSVTGHINTTSLNTTPTTKFELDTNQINLDSYLASPDQQLHLPVQLLRKIHASGTLSIEQLTIAGLHMTNMKTNAMLQHGAIGLIDTTAKLYEGTLDGSANIDVRQGTPSFSLIASLQQMQVAPLLNDFSGTAFVGGTANINLNLATSGQNKSKLFSNLNGIGSMNATNGSIQLLNIPHALTSANAIVTKQPAPKAEKTNQTEFQSLSGQFQFNNGQINSNNLQIAGKNFTATGKLAFALSQHSLRIHLNATSTTLPTLKNTKLPILITGNLNSPNIQANTEQVLQQIQRQRG